MKSTAVLLTIILACMGAGVIAYFMFSWVRGVLRGRFPGACAPAGAVFRVLICCFAVCGLYQVYSWLDYWRYRADRHAIDVLYIRFESAMEAGEWDAAYRLFSPDYRVSHNIIEFTNTFGFVSRGGHPLYPARALRVRGHRALLYPGWTAPFTMWSGPGMWLEKSDGTWCFTGECRWFQD